MRIRIGDQANYAQPHWTPRRLTDYASRMPVLNENIAELLKLAKRQQDVADAVGSDQSTVSRWAKSSKPEPDKLLALARYARVSVETLVEVPMAQWTARHAAGAAPGEVVVTEEDAADQLDAALISQVDVGYSMGGGSDVVEWAEQRKVPFSRAWLRSLTHSSPEKLAVAEGEGDSMTPTILDRDLVIIDRGEKRFNKQDRIWAFNYGQFGMIKRVRSLPTGEFQIISDNPAVAPFNATEDEIYFVGRVVGIVRKV
jgi:phage repressor protein C with HTH and peptisase S24 domain